MTKSLGDNQAKQVGWIQDVGGSDQVSQQRNGDSRVRDLDRFHVAYEMLKFGDEVMDSAGTQGRTHSAP